MIDEETIKDIKYVLSKATSLNSCYVNYEGLMKSTDDFTDQDATLMEHAKEWLTLLLNELDSIARPPKDPPFYKDWWHEIMMELEVLNEHDMQKAAIEKINTLMSIRG
jgi:hypothetical protein